MEHIFDARAMIQKGTVQSVDDTGPVQMVVVKTGDGAFHTAEVHQPFGHASVPPLNGCTALVFCIGGDPANMIAILTNPSKRFGGQAHGESTLYSSGGSRISIRSGGTVEIQGFAAVNTDAPAVRITAPASVTITSPTTTINGNLVVDGNITATGTITG